MGGFQHKKALITGGASGIGKLMGNLLLNKGLETLIIWDINESMLQTAVEEWNLQGFQVISYLVDVMDTEAVISAAQQVEQETGGIDILINNAGIIIGKAFCDHSHLDIDRTMRINCNALMHIAIEFLPGMLTRGNGHIVNIASAAGMLANPNMSVYVASKSAVLGWSDSLWLELRKWKGQINVTTVTPFYINTGMFEGVKSKIIPIVDAQIAARKIIAGIEKNKRYVRMPGIVNLLPLAKGLLPASWFDTLVGKWLGIYKSMDAFKGRKR